MLQITFQMGIVCLLLFVCVLHLPPMVRTAPLTTTDESSQDVCITEYINNRLSINCSDSYLNELPSGLSRDVHILDLSNNNFDTIPAELEEFTELEELSLAGNHLSGSLPSFVYKWVNLLSLNLANNNYDKWMNYGLSANLVKMDLSNNKINRIDESAFNGLVSLSYLDIDENRLYSIPQNLFSQTRNLDTLILSRNYLSEIPNFASTSLRKLDLSSCQISITQNALDGKTELLELNLSNNEIDFIPNNFASDTLQRLDLSYNSISALTDQTFSSLPQLVVIDLRGNNFEEVWWSSFFSSNPLLREIRLKGNRWSCEGFSINLLLTYEFLTRDPSMVTDPTSLICYTPANVTQMSWQEAYIRTWHQDDSYEPVTVTAVMVGVVIGVLLTSCVCRALMALNTPDSPTQTATQNLNNTVTIETRERTARTVMRIPLTEDLPPSYEDALLMPRLNTSFHSLPGFIDEEDEVERSRRFRRSRSIGDLVESRPRTGDRRSVRPTNATIEDEEENVTQVIATQD